LFKETKREGKAWRFDWVDDRGNQFKGIRFYPDGGILSSWSRKPHRMARDKYHPYRINDNDWQHVRQACITRWGRQVIAPKEPVKMAYYEPAFGANWVPYEKFKPLIERNLARWKLNGLLIEDR
jgi:hypothetical protein